MRANPNTPSPPARGVVCHITTVHSAFDPRVFHRECVSLAEAGYEVHLVAPHERDETVRGVQIHALPRPRGRLRRMLVWPWKAYRRVLAIRPRPAIVHFHDPELLPVGAMLRLRGFKVVYDVHENVADHIRQKLYLPPLVRGLVSLAYRLAERVLRRGMATVHVIESIAARYPEPKTVVRNFPQLAAVATPQRPGARRPRLVYVGAISRDRGAITMVQVAGTLARRGADFELRLVGPVYDPGLEDEIHAEASLGGVADRVTLLPLAPYERAMEEIAASDVGLCLLHPAPNYVNSLSVKILEYMQGGLPVVASDFACWREIVTSAEAGVLLDPLDVEKIADALVALLANPEVGREMGRRGREAVLARYNWDAEKRRLLDFYRRLLESGTPT